MKKEFITKKSLRENQIKKEKAIIESFAKTFNSIKRIDENEINGLSQENELFKDGGGISDELENIAKSISDDINSGKLNVAEISPKNGTFKYGAYIVKDFDKIYPYLSKKFGIKPEIIDVYGEKMMDYETDKGISQVDSFNKILKKDNLIHLEW